MKLYEIYHDPVAAAKEMEDLNAQMVVATGEYRALRTPEALKKITDLNTKIKAILKANAKEYDSLYEASPMTPYKARSEITKIALKLKIASSELMNRYKRRLQRFLTDTPKAIRALETDLNVPHGTLKGFDTLYDVATS